MADQYGCDPKKLGLARLCADYAKEVEDKVFLDLIAKYELIRTCSTGIIISARCSRSL